MAVEKGWIDQLINDKSCLLANIMDRFGDIYIRLDVK